MEVTEGHEHGRKEIGGALLLVVRGDLTTQGVDAVVNAANPQLQHGGGVAHALSLAGGSDVQRLSDEWVERHGALSPGTAAVTGGGNLPAEHVIHVVGPRYARGQDNEALLRQAVDAALEAAEELGASSLALPAISAGTYGYPLQEATAITARQVESWLAQHPEGALREIRLVGFDDEAAEAFAAALATG